MQLFVEYACTHLLEVDLPVLVLIVSNCPPLHSVLLYIPIVPLTTRSVPFQYGTGWVPIFENGFQILNWTRCCGE